MMLEIQTIELDADDDTDGRLVLHHGRLAAVLSHLSNSHPERSGRWFLECGFGAISRCEMEFDSLDAAAAWIEQRLGDVPDEITNPG